MGHTVTHHSFHDKLFSMLCFVYFFMIFNFGGMLQGLKMDARTDEWDWGACCESHKESIQSFWEVVCFFLNRLELDTDSTCWLKHPEVEGLYDPLLV